MNISPKDFHSNRAAATTTTPAALEELEDESQDYARSDANRDEDKLMGDGALVQQGIASVLEDASWRRTIGASCEQVVSLGRDGWRHRVA